MLDYDDQNYPYVLPVIVYFDNHSWSDAIKGLNKGHALYLAYKNWPSAKHIKTVGE